MDNLGTNNALVVDIISKDIHADEFQVETLIGTINTVNCDSLSSELITTDNNTLPDNLTAQNLECSGNASVTHLNVPALTCDTLNVQTLNTTISTINDLFADEIAQQHAAAIQMNSNTVTTTGLSEGQKIAIGFAVVLGVVALAVAAFAVASVATLALTVAASVGGITASTAGTAIGILALNAPVIAGQAALITAGAVAATVSVSTVAAVLPPATYKTAAVNSVYGTSFISNSIFGTTSYVDPMDPYTEYLLISNEINGSISLPRIIGYNPQLGSFDDGTAYGSQKAYLSLCTESPYNTLRFENNGNLAIYDSPLNAPTWETGTQVSDIRKKKDIEPIDRPLERIRQIRGVRYKYYNEDKVYAGVLAQDLAAGALPEAVYGDETKGYRVQLDRLFPLLIEGMKEVYDKQEEVLKSLDE